LLLCTLPNGDKVWRYKHSIVIAFQEKRKVLSTSHLNGGYREDLDWVFNHDIHSKLGLTCDITPANYLEHMKLIAGELGLNPDKSAGLLTAASMDNAAIRSQRFEDLEVTAIVTGGIEVNGGRVGDPAFYHQRQGEVFPIKEGTINILLHIDADLPEQTMVRALVTCTEAKTAALQELLAGSNYSRGLATGSGTDGTAIISNGRSKCRLLYAGKHSKLGELIGVTVKEAVKEALFLQTGLCPRSQFSVLRRLKRFGINGEDIRQEYQNLSGIEINEQDFTAKLAKLNMEEDLVIFSSLYAHLMDQLDWRMLTPEQAASAGEKIITMIAKLYGLDNSPAIKPGSLEETIAGMTGCFTVLLAKLLRSC